MGDITREQLEAIDCVVLKYNRGHEDLGIADTATIRQLCLEGYDARTRADAVRRFSAALQKPNVALLTRETIEALFLKDRPVNYVTTGVLLGICVLALEALDARANQPPPKRKRDG